MHLFCPSTIENLMTHETRNYDTCTEEWLIPKNKVRKVEVPPLEMPRTKGVDVSNFENNRY